MKSDFDPPPYIAKLIASINDGAKSAQLGALAFVAIGLFLLATSFSATDEDLLIGKAISISQLGGAAVPVSISFGFMPAIFLAVHLYTLIRYDLLTANLRQFQAELERAMPLASDRSRCVQLLANTEFVQAQLVPDSSWVFRWTSIVILAVFPVTVLLLVQLGSLRLQNPAVNVLHHVTIAGDLLLLIWFFHRQGRPGVRLWRWLLWPHRWLLPALVLAFDLAWCQLPSADETTVRPSLDIKVIWAGFSEKEDAAFTTSAWKEFLTRNAEALSKAAPQPVDLLLCPHLRLGCRYLSVPGRTLVAKVWDNAAFVELRAGQSLDERRKAAFDKLVLQDRRLRFADLSGSLLFAVDLSRAQLQGADLSNTRMPGADLNWAQMQGARLVSAQMKGANLFDAQLQGADLNRAQLQGAYLVSAQLQAADLGWTQLQGASLGLAQLQGAYLGSAWLQGADLGHAQLQGAFLGNAQFQSADLSEVQLQGADLRDVAAWRIQAFKAQFDDDQMMTPSFDNRPPSCPLVANLAKCPDPISWEGWIEQWLADIPVGDMRIQASQRLAILTAEDDPPGVVDTQEAWSILREPSAATVARRLGNLVCDADEGPRVARGILRQIRFPDLRKLGAERRNLARRMLAPDCPGARGLTEAERVELSKLAE